MPFTSYATEADVARAHQLSLRRHSFVVPTAFAVSQHMRDEIAFTLDEVPFNSAESFAREALIYPILREVWKPLAPSLTLWSGQAIAFDADLSGTPDFIVARRSHLGPFLFGLPYLLIVEAKRDDLSRGWGQCLAAMLAAQKILGQPDATTYGMTTNGRVWEFAKLEGSAGTFDPYPISVHDLDELAAAINFMMLRCRDLAGGAAGAA